MKNSDYIQLLKSAIGNEDKIAAALSTSNTYELQQYLISIGLDPSLTELAAVVEITRENLSNILKSPDCTITDKEITYDEGNKLYVAEDGKFYLSNKNYFVKSKDSDDVMFYQNGSIIHETSVINNFGAVVYYRNAGVSPYAGEYSDHERTILDGFPMVISESTDGATYGSSDRSVDFGHPLHPASKSSEFQENYYAYGSRYPKLKQWYDSYFPMQQKDEFECTTILNEKQHELDIEKLNLEISDYQGFLRNINSSNTENQEKLNKLLEYIRRLQKRTPIGKSVADKILSNLATIKPPQETSIKDESPANNVSDLTEKPEETSLEKKQRLEATLAHLKQEYNKSKGNSYYLNKQINLIQRELRQIPLIGNSLSKKASKVADTKKPAKPSYEDGQEY